MVIQDHSVGLCYLPELVGAFHAAGSARSTLNAVIVTEWYPSRLTFTDWVRLVVRTPGFSCISQNTFPRVFQYLHHKHCYKGKGKCKDVDLYSAFHAPGTPNALTSLELDRQTAILDHRPACKHSPGQWPNNGHRQRLPAVGLHLRNPSLMDYYSFNRPRRDRDSWLSWPCWLTDSGRLTHKVVTRPVISLAQDRESSPARTGVLTTMLRHQLCIVVSSNQNGLTSITVRDVNFR